MRCARGGDVVVSETKTENRCLVKNRTIAFMNESPLLGIFGVYLSDALSDLHTGKERGEQADPSLS